MATAVQNLYAIPRHGDGATRVSAGRVGGGTASNIVPESAFVEGEVRGETTALMEYAYDGAERTCRSAVEMHDCELDLSLAGDAPAAENDPAAVDAVERAARDAAGVDSVVRTAPLGGSEDATVLMRAVQENGGVAGYACVGTDHPGGHHTATFDVDEDSLPLGVTVLSDAVRNLAAAVRE
jgi:aminobenzoyl-glutamate utilization protein A